MIGWQTHSVAEQLFGLNEELASATLAPSRVQYVNSSHAARRSTRWKSS